MNRREIILGLTASIIPGSAWGASFPLPKKILEYIPVNEDPRGVVFSALSEVLDNNYDIYTRSQMWLVLSRLKQNKIILDFLINFYDDKEDGTSLGLIWVKYQEYFMRYNFGKELVLHTQPDPEWHPWISETPNITQISILQNQYYPFFLFLPQVSV